MASPGDRIVTGNVDNTTMPDALLEVTLSQVQRNPPISTEAEKTCIGIGE